MHFHVEKRLQCTSVLSDHSFQIVPIFGAARIFVEGYFRRDHGLFERTVLVHGHGWWESTDRILQGLGGTWVGGGGLAGRARYSAGRYLYRQTVESYPGDWYLDIDIDGTGEHEVQERDGMLSPGVEVPKSLEFGWKNHEGGEGPSRVM